jgi:hypothetical protein
MGPQPGEAADRTVSEAGIDVIGGFEKVPDRRRHRVRASAAGWADGADYRICAPTRRRRSACRR